MALAHIVKISIELVKMELSVLFLNVHMMQLFSLMVHVSNAHFTESLDHLPKDVFFQTAVMVKLLQRQDYVSLVHHFKEVQTVNSDVMTKLVQPMRSYKKMDFVYYQLAMQINLYLTKELAKTVLIIHFHLKQERSV